MRSQKGAALGPCRPPAPDTTTPAAGADAELKVTPVDAENTQTLFMSGFSDGQAEMGDSIWEVKSGPPPGQPFGKLVSNLEDEVRLAICESQSLHALLESPRRSFEVPQLPDEFGYGKCGNQRVRQRCRQIGGTCDRNGKKWAPCWRPGLLKATENAVKCMKCMSGMIGAWAVGRDLLASSREGSND